MPDILSVPVSVLGHSHSDMGSHHHFEESVEDLQYRRSLRLEHSSVEKNHDVQLMGIAPQSPRARAPLIPGVLVLNSGRHCRAIDTENVEM